MWISASIKVMSTHTHTQSTSENKGRLVRIEKETNRTSVYCNLCFMYAYHEYVHALLVVYIFMNVHIVLYIRTMMPGASSLMHSLCYISIVNYNIMCTTDPQITALARSCPAIESSRGGAFSFLQHFFASNGWKSTLNTESMHQILH